MTCTVDMLTEVKFGADVIPGVQGATSSKSGTPQEYVAASNANIQLVGIDRIGTTVTVTTITKPDATKFFVGAVKNKVAGPPIVPGLTMSTKPRAEGSGLTGTATDEAHDVAVCLSVDEGPVIEGNPTYSITFRCHPTAA
jgi:hypothetical protein